MTRLPDLGVALAAILALVFSGGLAPEMVYASLGSEIVWLLIVSFLVAGVLKGSGLVERAVAVILAPVRGVSGLFHALTLAIALTAFLVPSTSGRAALLLPVFLALADRLPDPRLVRPLALLFPSIILLSAGGALTGAGAHVVAIDVLAQHSGLAISPFRWILLALPVSLAASYAATVLILALFVPAELRHAKFAGRAEPPPSARHRSSSRWPRPSRSCRTSSSTRSARAAVLLPMVALPLIGLGHDPVAIVMVIVLGTGFCQTLMASAKPVAIFGQLDRPTFGQGDLLRLALPLLPIKFALLVGVALFVWPHQIPSAGTGGAAPALAAPVLPTSARQAAPAIEPIIAPVVDAPAAMTPVAAAAPPAPATCGDAELRTVMISTIGERRMWASGWWHVWKRLTRDGIAAERETIKRLYRADDLVRLRRGNHALSALGVAEVEAAFRLCRKG